MQISPEQRTKLLEVATYEGFVFSVIVLLQTFFQILTFDYVGSFLTRGDGTTGNPIFASYFLIFTLAATLSTLSRAGKSWLRVFLFVALFMETWAVLMTGTRSGWIGFIAVLLIFLIFGFVKSSSHARRQLFAPVFVIVLFAVLLSMFGSIVRSNTEPSDQQGSVPVSSQSISQREAIWMYGINVFIHHPFIGIGLDNMAAYYRLHHPSDIDPSSGVTFDQVHNLLLQILVTTGLLGGACMVAFGYIVFRKPERFLYADDLTVPAYAAALTGILIGAFFNPLDVLSWTIILYCCAALLSADSIEFTLGSAWWKIGAVSVLVFALLGTFACTCISAADVFYQKAQSSFGIQSVHYYKIAVDLNPFTPATVTAYDAAFANIYDALPPKMGWLQAMNPHLGITYISNGKVEAYIGYTTKNFDLFNRGIADLDKGLALEPNSAPIMGNVAAWHVEAGQLDVAAQLLQDVLKIDPSNEPAAQLLTDVYVKQGKYSMAYDALTRAYMIDPLNHVNIKHILNVAKKNGDKIKYQVDYELSAG